MYFSNDFHFGRSYPHEVAHGFSTRTFECKCGVPVTTVSTNKYQCDKCQLESNREAARRASQRQSKKNKEKRARSSAPHSGKFG